MIKIKPHHFLDIIKLYGNGIENFLPDKEYKHSFYSIANEIIGNKNTVIKLTIYEDDICSTCKYISDSGVCTDRIAHIEKIESKDEWNKILDKRILKVIKAEEGDEFTAVEFCELLYSSKEYIYEIWKEETEEAKNNRYYAFCKGSEKYLKV